MRLTLLAIAALAGAGAGTGATAASTHAATIAEPARATPIDADRGGLVWSAYDAEINAFRLTYRTRAGETRVLPVTPSPVPFDADLGEDIERHKAVAYTACPTGPESCDIRVHSIASGEDQLVAPAATPGVGEYAPTLSRGTLVWAVGGGQGQRARVLLSRLSGNRGTRELPGLPRRRCGEHDRGRFACRPVYGRVAELELRGSTLAQVVHTRLDKELDNAGQAELRIVDIEKRTSEQVLRSGTGESGQSIIGLSIDGNVVYAYKTCFGDPSGCNRNAGTLRYRMTERQLHLAEDRRQLSGFAVDRSRVFTADGSERRMCELEQGSYPTLQNPQIGPCPIEDRELPTRWSRVRRR